MFDALEWRSKVEFRPAPSRSPGHLVLLTLLKSPV